MVLTLVGVDNEDEGRWMSEGGDGGKEEVWEGGVGGEKKKGKWKKPERVDIIFVVFN